MSLASLSVRYAISVTMIYLMVVGFGLFSLSRLGLDLFPDISFPVVMVITNYEGASPEDIETLVTKPIEGAGASVKDVKELSSTSKQGTSLVQVSFPWGKDMEQAETDVRRALDLVKGLLPEDAAEPMVFAFDPSLQPVVMMMLSGPYPLDELRRIAENEVEPRLTRLPGIASTEVAGGLEREIQVVLDPTKVAAFGLDVMAVIGAVYRENSQVPGGTIQQGTLDFTIQSGGKYRSVAEIGEIVVGAKQTLRGPVPVRLRELAEVKDSFYESQRVLEVDGEPAVWLMVRKQSGANTVLAVRAVMDALPEIKRAAAADVDFKIIFDQAEFINLAIGNLSSTAWIGVALTFLVLLAFLRHVTSSLIVAVSIPVSVVATFGIMDQAGMTLNILTLAGLALSIGMLVDNSIVVLENVFRLRELGRGARPAAIEGARGVSMAVTASTLTTVVVFVPVLFVPGIAGVLFRDMSVVICFSLMVSLLVALTFVPLTASRLLGSVGSDRGVARASGAGRLLRALTEGYGRSLDWCLGRRWAVGLAVLGMLGGAGLLAVALPTEFITEDDQSMLFVSVETPIGNNLRQTHAIMKEVEKQVLEVVRPEERRLVALEAGVGKGFVALFSKGVHAGLIRVRLVSPEKRKRTQKEIEAAVRERLRRIPGIKYSAAMPFNVMGGEGDIEVQIRGHDLGVSRAVGLELRDKILALPEMAEVVFSMEDQKPEVRVTFDRRKLGELGLSVAGAGQAVSTYFMGKLAGRYAEGGDEYDIVVRYAKEHRLDVDELRKMPLSTPLGQVVPLGNVASVELGLGPVDIMRLDQERVTRLQCRLRAEYVDAKGKSVRKDLGRATDRVEQILKAYAWPRNFGYYIGGTAEDLRDSFRYLGLALLVSVLLVYMVMASQFESLRQPFIVMFTVPLAAIGVVPMFSLTRSSFDIPAIIGVIMLVGIVVNNGIVMIDCANRLRGEEGLGRREAIAKAARIRLRPVLMTALTTILGMVPLALEIGEGAAGWAGLAKAVIGGLTTASFLTLLVVPVVYTLFAPKRYVPPFAGETAAVPAPGESRA
ncbi:MAG: efflux RND transporter permease subunit [Deltaproteobacteria bacterium]|nr:efflux RND transporter permease subunit [Deltaproteobacteria bacterium]